MAVPSGSKLRHVVVADANAGARLTCGHVVSRPWELNPGQRVFCRQCHAPVGDPCRSCGVPADDHWRGELVPAPVVKGWAG